MEVLSGKDEEKALEFLKKAAEIARGATCRKAACGSVIVKNGDIIGRGFNSPPKGLESERRCGLSKGDYNERVTDKTCCVHAEQRAIIDALKKNPQKVEGSRLYFMRLGDGGEWEEAEEPYCTICSKMALDVGIAEFVLWKKEGVCVYSIEEYNKLSFDYGKRN